MSKSKPSSLSPSLVTKGAAKPVLDVLPSSVVASAPVTDQVPVVEMTSSPDPVLPVNPPTRRTPKPVVSEKPLVATGATKSMTVKIDEATYKTLKLHGLETGKSSQDIFVEALAGYFKQHQL